MSAVEIAPRLLTREQAAAYVNLAPKVFDRWRKAGRLPGPLPQSARYDLKAIDAAIDRMCDAPGTEPSKAASTDTVGSLADWRKRRKNG